MSIALDLEIQRTYSIDAEPSERGNGWIGFFSIPGKDRQSARNDDGSISVLDSEDEALVAAGEDLCETMNSRTIGTQTSYGYRVMGGAELAVRLKRLGLSPAKFSVYCGTSHERVMDWIDGKMPIPRTVNLIAELLSLPGAMDAAQRLTDSIIFNKKDRAAEIKAEESGTLSGPKDR